SDRWQPSKTRTVRANHLLTDRWRGPRCVRGASENAPDARKRPPKLGPRWAHLASGQVYASRCALRAGLLLVPENLVGQGIYLAVKVVFVDGSVRRALEILFHGQFTLLDDLLAECVQALLHLRELVQLALLVVTQ